MLTYLDQNALINLYRRCDQLRRIETAVRTKRRIVLSPWHLVETANTRDLRKAVDLADFIDGLDCLWLLERRSLQRLDVAEDLWRFAALHYDPAPRIVARREALADLNRESASPKFDIPSRAFVKGWIKHPHLLATLKRSIEQNISALRSLRQRRPDMRRSGPAEGQAHTTLVECSMPALTPAGLTIEPQIRARYLAQVDPMRIPSLALEIALSRAAINGIGRNDRNTLIDKFHAIGALPHVEEIVTDDKFFRRVLPEVIKTGFVRAKLRNFGSFWSDLN